MPCDNYECRRKLDQSADKRVMTRRPCREAGWRLRPRDERTLPRRHALPADSSHDCHQGAGRILISPQDIFLPVFSRDGEDVETRIKTDERRFRLMLAHWRRPLVQRHCEQAISGCRGRLRASAHDFSAGCRCSHFDARQYLKASSAVYRISAFHLAPQAMLA